MLNLKKNYSKIILKDSLKRSNDSLAVIYFNKSLRSDPDDEILIAKNYNELAELNFRNKDYPNESAEQEIERIEAAKEEGSWKASSTSIENTIEIPSIPKTKRGLKFQAAAAELNLISD